MAVTIFSDGRIIDSNGINLAPKTVVDKWRLTGSVTGNQDPISSKLERDIPVLYAPSNKKPLAVNLDQSVTGDLAVLSF